MSCIHYKFRSALEYDTITFDGLSISLADLKRSIITQKKFGKNTDFDLEVTNAQTKEEYKDEMTMIPKNSSVVVRRIPIGTKSKAQLAAERASPFSSGEQKTSGFQDYQVTKSQKLSKVADLANADASEEDKLKAMMKQSGEDWDPSQYVRGRRPYAPGVPVPQSYVCYRCGKPGHFIRNCPTNGDSRFDVPKAKRTTGIPRTFLGTTEGTASPPSRSSPSLPEMDSKTKGKDKDTANKKVPSELRCPTCNNLLADAVLIPCCGTSYCDDCIRNYLLENEQECPSCGQENVSPDSLVINKQLRQAVNTFKNARPASPYMASLPKSTTAVTSNTEAKSQPATKVVTDSVSDKATPESEPVDIKVVKEVNETDSKMKESSPKPAQQPVKPVTSQPHPIRVHHREATAQQGVGLKQGGAPFDPRRRQGDFLPRGPSKVPDLRHGLSEPIGPHGLPPEHVPRVPAVRPHLGGPSHPGPHVNVPGYVPNMRAAAPASMPHIPPVPTLLRAPLPRHPAFGAPMFDPLYPADVSRSLTPPMSEREFYKMQKKLKSRSKRKREQEHSSSSYTSRESRPKKELKKEPRREPRKEPKKDGGIFDFDDELSEYRKLQKSRQRLRSRSLTPSRSLSRSQSRSRSRSRSLSQSRSRSRSRTPLSASPTRSPTPEGWDESRSPSPAPSRDQSETASAEKEKRKHKKRKKEPKSKERKKQKASHGEEDEPSAKQKEEPGPGNDEAKTLEKKKHKQREKEKVNGKETEEDKYNGKDVGKEKNKKEMKEKEKDKGKKKEKDKKRGSDKEGKQKEKEDKKNKEKKKKKEKDKKDEPSSGKKRKSKKKHKKHKRHKKEKSKDEKDADEEETGKNKVKDSENQGVSSEAGNPEEKATTEEEEEENEDQETQDSDEDEEHQDKSDEEEDESEEEREISEEEKEDEKIAVEQEEEREQERISKGRKEKGKMDVEQRVDEDGRTKDEKETNESEDERLHACGNDEEIEGKESDIDEDKLLGNESDEDKEPEVEMDQNKPERSGNDVETGNRSDEDTELVVEIAEKKPGGNGSDGDKEPEGQVDEKKQGEGESDEDKELKVEKDDNKLDETNVEGNQNKEKLLGSLSDKENERVSEKNEESKKNDIERQRNGEKDMK